MIKAIIEFNSSLNKPQCTIDYLISSPKEGDFIEIDDNIFIVKSTKNITHYKDSTITMDINVDSRKEDKKWVGGPNFT
jgi:hypothetical protein